MAEQIVYYPTRTGAKYHASKASVRLILGPVGSGKSVANCIEDYRMVAEDMPACKDGIKRARIAIVRNTYPELKLTTIKTWRTWFPEEVFGRISQISPMQQTIRLEGIEVEVYFLALNNDKDVKKLLSLELTHIFFNELREINEQIFDAAIMRIGRYPSKAMLPDGASYKPRVLCDSNYFDKRSWIYERFFTREGRAHYKDYEVFEQPAPFIRNDKDELIENPLAENIENLQEGYGYYWRIYESNAPEIFDVLVMCNFASGFSGKRVFPGYSAKIHRSLYKIKPNIDYEVCLGFDFGRSPACAITQYINGQFIVLEEVFSEENIGLDDFYHCLLAPILSREEYRGAKIVSVCDPAGVRRNDTDDNYCINKLNEFGLNAISAPTNKIKPRIEVMRKQLGLMLSGAPALLLSSVIEFIHEGFLGGYKYREIRQISGARAYTEEPDKNEYSHIFDALIYALCNYCYFELKEKPKDTGYVMLNGRMTKL